jgi:hypothetical protein
VAFNVLFVDTRYERITDRLSCVVVAEVEVVAVNMSESAQSPMLPKKNSIIINCSCSIATAF